MWGSGHRTSRLPGQRRDRSREKFSCGDSSSHAVTPSAFNISRDYLGAIASPIQDTQNIYLQVMNVVREKSINLSDLMSPRSDSTKFHAIENIRRWAKRTPALNSLPSARSEEEIGGRRPGRKLRLRAGSALRRRLSARRVEPARGHGHSAGAAGVAGGPDVPGAGARPHLRLGRPHRVPRHARHRAQHRRRHAAQRAQRPGRIRHRRRYRCAISC